MFGHPALLRRYKPEARRIEAATEHSHTTTTFHPHYSPIHHRNGVLRRYQLPVRGASDCEYGCGVVAAQISTSGCTSTNLRDAFAATTVLLT
jgi:hypothetical protein